MNGVTDPRNLLNTTYPQQQQQKLRNYKLLIDPQITKGAVKIYRYDGVMPGDPISAAVIPRDPRSPLARVRPRHEPLELIVPRY